MVCSILLNIVTTGIVSALSTKDDAVSLNILLLRIIITECICFQSTPPGKGINCKYL